MGKTSSKPDADDGSSVVMLQYYGQRHDQDLSFLQEEFSSGDFPIAGDLINMTKNGQKMRFGWYGGFGRSSMRPIMWQYFCATDVIVFVINPEKNVFIEPFYIDDIHQTTSHPDLSNVTILVIATSCEENTEDLMGADEVRKKFEDHCLVFPNQTLHVIASEKLDKEVMEKAFTLAAERRMAKDQPEESKTEKLLKNKSVNQKLKSKIVQHWKTLRIF